MPEPTAHRIMLLPQADYWAWVGAARDYAVRFKTTLTPTPQNAARYHFPKQVISVVATPDGYPQYKDIVAWLRSEAPGVQLDVLDVASPEALSVILNERIARNDASWVPPSIEMTMPEPADTLPLSNADGDWLAVVDTEPALPTIQLLWPTDYPDVLQEFGDNPDIYERFGYPGHEGIDIKAPLNSNIYACAAGHVYHVDDGTTGHPYGIHVRIRHTNGYSTIYAHLNQALVVTGQEVGAGEQLGLANSTGNATSSHLHLTLTKSGATQAGLTAFPNDIIDPTPYFVSGPQQAPTALASYDWQFSHCLIGVNLPEDDGEINRDSNTIIGIGVEAVKLKGVSAAANAQHLTAQNANLLVFAQVTTDLSRNIVNPPSFVSQVIADVEALYAVGIRYIELHNEPNLSIEGFGTSWRSGSEFGDWYLAVVALLKSYFPEAHFGWPGLSPGGTGGMRFDHHAFLASAASAVAQADWIGCHCYWQSREGMYSGAGGTSFRYYRDLWPDKLLVITDAANVRPTYGTETKMQEYRDYFALLRHEPGVGAVFVTLPDVGSEYGYFQLLGADYLSVLPSSSNQG